MRHLGRFVALLLALVLCSPTMAFARDALPVSLSLGVRDIAFSGMSVGMAVGDGVLATNDGGTHWYRQFAPFERLNAVDMASATAGWAVGEQGVIIRTTDGGANWVRCTSGSTANLLDVDFVDASVGWAVGSGATLLKTSNGGSTWVRQTLPQGEFRQIHGVSFVDRNNGWVCGDSMTSGDGAWDLYIARTTNGGATWTRCSPGENASGGSDDMWSYTAIDFVSPTTGWVTGWLPGVHKTTNGGGGWVTQPAGGTRIDFFDSLRGISLLNGTASYTTDGGRTWGASDLSTGLMYAESGNVRMTSTTQAWAVAYGWNGTSEGEISHTLNGGANWHTQKTSAGHVFFLGGATRYDTAANVSRIASASAGTVVLATGRDYPDALAASGLAGAMSGTLLITDSTLPTAVRTAITDLGTTRVIIIGGEAAVSEAVEADLASTYTVERIGGENRYETAANVARRMVAEGVSTDEVFVASGEGYADATSASAIAYARDMPVLLARSSVLPTATLAALVEIGPRHVDLVGGTAAIGGNVQDAIDSATGPGVSARVAAGADRYDTSARLATWAEGRGWIDFSRVGIATGANFPDALCGAALMGSMNHPLLLSKPTALPSYIDTLIASRSVDDVWIINDRGTGAVRDAVGTRLSYLIR